jgi:hypothetical protein
MTDAIAAGTLLVDERACLPRSLALRSESSAPGWAAARGSRPEFEKAIEEAGWTYFFMAEEMKATVFGFDRQKAMRAALKRLIADVKSQHCNSIEITRVAGDSFLGLPYVSVSAHPRHIQEGRSAFRPAPAHDRRQIV